MPDRVRALLAEAPGLELASQLAPVRLPVLPAFEAILPFGGLRLGTTVGITGVGATSLALALIARASRESWTATVGLPGLSLRAAAELEVDLDRLVVVPDPGTRWMHVLAAVVDAFDIVVFGGQHGAPRTPRRINARVREQDAVLVAIGSWPDSDLTIRGTTATWHGIGRGHGHLRTRTLSVSITGRGAAARPVSSTLWLPDADGRVSLATDGTVVPIRRSG